MRLSGKPRRGAGSTGFHCRRLEEPAAAGVLVADPANHAVCRPTYPIGSLMRRLDPRAHSPRRELRAKSSSREACVYIRSISS